MVSAAILRTTKITCCGVLLLGTLTSWLANTVTRWTITEDYTVAFSGSGAEGTFRGLTGTIVFDSTNLGQSVFDVAVDARTIATGNDTKDRHARGDSWFDVERYQEIHFTSSRITRTATGYQATGTLRLHGVEREIELPFTFAQQGDTGTFKGSFTVNRQDYGIEGPFFGFVVGDDFDVTLTVPVRQ